MSLVLFHWELISTPNGVLYNPDTDSLFVADTNSSTVHVIKNP